MIFYFSDYTFFLPILLVLCILCLILLLGPFFIFYIVFRNPNKRPSDYSVFKSYAKWSGLMINSLIIFFLIYLNSIFPAIDAIYISRLIFISWLLSTLALIFGILTIPKWQGLVTLATFCIVWFLSFILLSSH